jgi:NTE family protein
MKKRLTFSNETILQKVKEEYNIGFVLSGGGARGFAHLGIIEALREKGIYPDIISGVSAGAITGAFLASGKTPREIHEILKREGLFKLTKIQFPKNGLMRLDGLQKLLDDEIPFKTLEELPIPLYIGVSNLTNAETEYRNKGPLGRIVLASSSIPVLFSPVEMQGSMFADGGLLNNVPIEPLIGKCRKIIVSNISPLQKPAIINGLVQLITRTFLMSIHARIQEARNHADLYIEPEELTRYDILGISHADEMFDIGYNTVMKLEDSCFTDLLKG